MVFISLDELLPAAKKYDEAHTSIYGLIAGMAVMAVSCYYLFKIEMIILSKRMVTPVI